VHAFSSHEFHDTVCHEKYGNGLVFQVKNLKFQVKNRVTLRDIVYIHGNKIRLKDNKSTWKEE